MLVPNAGAQYQGFGGIGGTGTPTPAPRAAPPSGGYGLTGIGALQAAGAAHGNPTGSVTSGWQVPWNPGTLGTSFGGSIPYAGNIQNYAPPPQQSFQDSGGGGGGMPAFNLTNDANPKHPETSGLLFNFDGTVQSGLGDPRQAQLGLRLLF